MSQEIFPVATEPQADQSTIERFRSITAGLQRKLGRLAATGLVIAGGVFTAYTVEEAIHPEVAAADVLGYPDADATDCHIPYGTYSWCKNGGPLAYRSTRGYDYRNCTDYVAWKLQSLGVSNSDTSGLGNGGDWYNNAPASKKASYPSAGDAAVVPGTTSNPWGHVAYVESVNGDGTITVSEYNHDAQGNGDTRTGTPSSMGFSKYVDFGVHSTPATTTSPIKKVDLLVHDGGTTNWAVATSTGSAFSGSGNWLGNWGGGDFMGLADVTGDGLGDIVVHNPFNATYGVAENNNVSFYGGLTGTWLNGWGAGDWAGLGDVNGDGKADLVVHNPSNAEYDVALSNGSSFGGGGGNWLSGWSAGDKAMLGDVNGDGKADLVVHNPSNATYAVALSSGSGFNAGGGTWLSGWGGGDFIGTGDVNGDGKADLVVHNGGNWAVATSTGSSFSGSGNWLTGWGAGDWAGLGDLNGDGKADVVVHNPSNAEFDVALSNGSSFSGGGGNWLSGWGGGDFIGLANLNSD